MSSFKTISDEIPEKPEKELMSKEDAKKRLYEIVDKLVDGKEDDWDLDQSVRNFELFGQEFFDWRFWQYDFTLELGEKMLLQAADDFIEEGIIMEAEAVAEQIRRFVRAFRYYMLRDDAFISVYGSDKEKYEEMKEAQIKKIVDAFFRGDNPFNTWWS